MTRTKKVIRKSKKNKKELTMDKKGPTMDKKGPGENEKGLKKGSAKNKKGQTNKKISKIDAELIAFIGAGSCGNGCTSGDFGTLTYDIMKTGVGVVDGIASFGETALWMMVDMPNELLGAVESPSSNVPLTNII
tara:strand:+ start:189 stop:590 length:402 start_codon:yes stop_codon:yes gene_type:complete